MSSLRLFGCIVGIIGLFGTFLIYRGPKWKRSSFILFALFNISLVAISINPDILNAVRDALSLQETQRGRIVALLVISNIFLLFYLFFTRLKVENIHFQFDRLARALGRHELEKTVELAGGIKPIMILIPAFNEADNLKELLPQIPKQIEGDDVGILVVDDGSEDETYAVAAESEGVFVVKNPINRGGHNGNRISAESPP